MGVPAGRLRCLAKNALPMKNAFRASREGVDRDAVSM
jgi:hypothetical protein